MNEIDYAQNARATQKLLHKILRKFDAIYGRYATNEQADAIEDQWTLAEGYNGSYRTADILTLILGNPDGTERYVRTYQILFGSGFQAALARSRQVQDGV